MRKIQAFSMSALLWLCTCFGSTTVHAEPLKLAILNFPSLAVAHIALAKNYFEEQGIEVKAVPVLNGKEALAMLHAGTVDLGIAADLPMVLASLDGVQFEILATIANSNAHGVYARSDRGIRTPADLKGKRIAIIKDTVSRYYTESLLIFYGINPDQTTIIPMDSKRATAALVRGEVDAAALFEPFRQQALSSMGTAAISIKNPKIFTATLNLFAAPSKINNDDAKKLLRALIKAADFIRKTPHEAQEIVASKINASAELLASGWKDYDFSVTLQQPMITAFETQTRWIIRNNLVPHATMPDFLNYIRIDPLRQIAPTAVDIAK